MQPKSKIIYVDSQKELLKKIIDVFSAVWIPEKFRLTKKETTFFIECIMLNARGVDLLSREANKILNNLPSFPKRSTFIYRNKLKKKGWISQTVDGLKIHPDFDFKNSRLPLTVNINVPLKVAKKTPPSIGTHQKKDSQ